jgi:hypothetical protein
MVAKSKPPGVLLVFDNDVYYIEVADYDAVVAKISEIKEALVGEAGAFADEAVKLDSDAYLELTKLEVRDIHALLCGGITIRAGGR